jgi:hypothetical protein
MRLALLHLCLVLGGASQQSALCWTEIEAELAFVGSQITKGRADFLVIHPMDNGFLMDLAAQWIIQMEDQFDDITDLQGVGQKRVKVDAAHRQIDHGHAPFRCTV